ncbi:hypothetical protein C8R45DRAFT_1034817 [Mycena sanguinolenta]|nr:hypothetical protein C8R45DRAFT_1034817 [Mycena sanguinolenta]
MKTYVHASAHKQAPRLVRYHQKCPSHCCAPGVDPSSARHAPARPRQQRTSARARDASPFTFNVVGGEGRMSKRQKKDMRPYDVGERAGGVESVDAMWNTIGGSYGFFDRPPRDRSSPSPSPPCPQAGLTIQRSLRQPWRKSKSSIDASLRTPHSTSLPALQISSSCTSGKPQPSPKAPRENPPAIPRRALAQWPRDSSMRVNDETELNC